MPPCTWIAVSHTSIAARAQYALARVAAVSASSAASASTAQAACSVMLREPSMATNASASRCWTAWNEPMAAPYCRRSAA